MSDMTQDQRAIALLRLAGEQAAAANAKHEALTDYFDGEDDFGKVVHSLVVSSQLKCNTH